MTLPACLIAALTVVVTIAHQRLVIRRQRRDIAKLLVMAERERERACAWEWAANEIAAIQRETAENAMAIERRDRVRSGEVMGMN